MSTQQRNAALITLVLAATSLSAQHTRGAKMTYADGSKDCIQIKDGNTWTQSTDRMDGVGTATTADNLVANQLTTAAVPLTASTRPPAAGFGKGFAWAGTDETTSTWIPQAMSIGTFNNKETVFVSWFWNGSDVGNKGVRISLVDVSDLDHPKYRHVILAQPTGTNTYDSVNIHAGGITVIQHYLYVADTTRGLRVFNLDNIRHMDTTSCTAGDGSPIFGHTANGYCAGGFEYMLPQISAYWMVDQKEDGTPIGDTCKPKFSFTGKDDRGTTNFLLSGEYCGPAGGSGGQCEGDSSYLNGRLYRWPIGSNGKLDEDAAGYVSPNRVYFMNESEVQGVAPDMNLADNGDYPYNTYYLSSTYGGGKIYRASPNWGTETWSYANDAPYHPEGMYGTFSKNMWINTEGCCGSSDPSSTGRSVFYLHQSAIE